MAESEPLTPERVKEIVAQWFEYCREHSLAFADPGSADGHALRMLSDLQALATDWQRLHALHALSPADQQRVAEIRERLGKASEGPWSANEDEGTIEVGAGFVVARVQPHGNLNTIVRTGEPFSSADLAFLAESRADVSWLLGLLERGEAKT